MILTTKHRRLLLAGKRPVLPIADPEDCPEGEEVLSRTLRVPDVVIRWTGAYKKDGDYYAGYSLVDTRASRLLRRQGGYTSNASLAVDDAGEGVTHAEQEAITKQKTAQWQASRHLEVQRRRVKSAANRLRELQARAEREGMDLSTIIDQLERIIEAGREEINEREAA